MESAAFGRPTPTVEVTITDPLRRVGTPNKGHPVSVNGEEHHHGDEVSTDVASANLLIRAGCAELVGKGSVRVRVLDPHGAPAPHDFAIRFDDRDVHAGERVRMTVQQARDLVRARAAEWVGAPPSVSDLDDDEA